MLGNQRETSLKTVNVALHYKYRVKQTTEIIFIYQPSTSDKNTRIIFNVARFI